MNSDNESTLLLIHSAAKEEFMNKGFSFEKAIKFYNSKVFLIKNRILHCIFEFFVEKHQNLFKLLTTWYNCEIIYK